MSTPSSSDPSTTRPSTSESRRLLRRMLVALGLVCALAGMSVATAPATSADPDIPINQVLDVTTHLKTLNQDIQTDGGTLTGTLDLGTGDLTGELALPPTETPLQLAGIVPLANVGTEVVPTGPITGHVDLATSTITTTSSFHLKIRYVRPLGLPLNLVGNRCQTSRPITLTTSGTIDLATQAGTISGEFAIPPLQNCGIFTSLLNPLVAGDGNTFTASVRPAAA
jgi:hypothetical protein